MFHSISPHGMLIAQVVAVGSSRIGKTSLAPLWDILLGDTSTVDVIQIHHKAQR
jgi:hypothetical protein